MNAIARHKTYESGFIKATEVKLEIQWEFGREDKYVYCRVEWPDLSNVAGQFLQAVDREYSIYS